LIPFFLDHDRGIGADLMVPRRPVEDLGENLCPLAGLRPDVTEELEVLRPEVDNGLFG